jgi:hypothetical protein
MFMIFGLVDGGFLMKINGAPADSSLEASPPTPTIASAAPWRRAALFLAGAAQLITIPARVSPDRLRACPSGRLPLAPPGPGAGNLCAEEGVSR